MTCKLYFAAIACALFAAPVTAQTNCGATPAAYEMLALQFGESRVWMGQTDNGVLAEVWANPDTGTWTWLVTGAGQTCLVAQGAGYSLGAPL
jgi:hypothetical protein